ncbi:MAG: molybdenum cofactor guanylyltransferase [Pyrinomonadaceae bacterium]
MKIDFTSYILSGGKSSRMGTDKAFLKFGEKTFLENAVGILESNCENVKIVLNKSQNHFIEKLPDGVSHIFDIHENRGALGGIHAALQDCKTEFAIILAVDLPFVTSEAIEKLCVNISQEKDSSAIVPRQTDGKLQPLCAVYRAKDCRQKAEDILSKTDSASVRDFLETTNVKIIDSKSWAQNQNLFLNINFQSDYETCLSEK